MKRNRWHEREGHRSVQPVLVVRELEIGENQRESGVHHEPRRHQRGHAAPHGERMLLGIDRLKEPERWQLVAAEEAAPRTQPSVDRELDDTDAPEERIVPG